MKNTTLNQEIKKLKTIVKNENNLDILHEQMGLLYERISNIKDTSYNTKYNLQEILTSKTIKQIRKVITADSGIVIEFVKYNNAPNGFVMIYNDFINYLPHKIDIYIIKENLNNE